MSDYILETKNLKKNFHGFTAVDEVNIKIRQGSVHALIGPNGAGKTTCFNLLTKFLIPTSGDILFFGEKITDESPEYIARRGIIRSFQISAIFPDLTVFDNIRVGLQRATGKSYHFWRSESILKNLDNTVLELLDQVDLTEFAYELAVNLSYGRKRALELATTLAMDPILMLLDEPTQGMGHEDVSKVTQLIKRVGEGRTILMVEHNMSVVAEIADTITVLTRGRVLAEGTYHEVSNNVDVMEAYMGTSVTAKKGDS